MRALVAVPKKEIEAAEARWYGSRAFWTGWIITMSGFGQAQVREASPSAARASAMMRARARARKSLTGFVGWEQQLLALVHD